MRTNRLFVAFAAVSIIAFGKPVAAAPLGKPVAAAPLPICISVSPDGPSTVQADERADRMIVWLNKQYNRTRAKNEKPRSVTIARRETAADNCSFQHIEVSYALNQYSNPAWRRGIITVDNINSYTFMIETSYRQTLVFDHQDFALMAIFFLNHVGNPLWTEWRPAICNAGLPDEAAANVRRQIVYKCPVR